MGQKIHPLGFRVGITKKHQSVWFARFHKYQYAQSVFEDQLLRKTVLKMLSEILQKKFTNAQNIPKISHIKIERGLIPYEIGIQIYAQDCDLMKSAIDKLEIPANLIHNVLKNNLVLQTASLKGKEMILFNTEKTQKKLGEKEGSSKKQKWIKTNLQPSATQTENVLQTFRERFLQNMMIVKNGKKITRKFQTSEMSSIRQSILKKELFFSMKEKRRFSSFNKNTRKNRQTVENSLQSKTALAFKKSFKKRYALTSSSAQSQKLTKFVNIFVSKTNKSFVHLLKEELTRWNQYLKTYKEKQMQTYGFLRFSPVGYQKKWSLTRLKRLQKQSVPILMKLLKALQKQALKKMEILRKEFLIVGKLSKAKSFSYFQRIRFIKALRTLIKELKTKQVLFLKQGLQSSTTEPNRQIQKKFEKSLLNLTEKGLQQKLSNIPEENRKVKLIDYLQNIVKEHRQKNVFLYLKTISDSHQYLQKIQRFTKQQSSFLYGVNMNTLHQLPEEKKRDLLKNQILKTLKQVHRKNVLQKTLRDVFVEQLQKQRTICRQNIELTPKISLKFYSVKPLNLQTKASTVADTIVDDLEKRKAFRRVIKKAKEDLMKTPKVKGVKIQVAGRLNGAEIARSEWVRAGRVPLQTLRANIDYCYKTAHTIYGIIGVKVWIYKGYTKNRSTNPKSSSLLPYLT
uniref:Small ribosomal subunit protein uS3c n=1 Tax=Rotundella rotunda TaxID=1357779 RepID=A0A140GIH5_9CHLO|nr:ribosomal protein S3 [Rotundella rotunda]